MQLLSIERKIDAVPDSVLKLRQVRRRAARLSTRGLVSLAVTSAALALLVGTTRPPAPTSAISIPAPAAIPQPSAPLAKIWIVEQRDTESIYSNGLPIRSDYLVSSRSRSYRSFDRATLRPSELRHAPAGIVYHTTESALQPLDAGHNPSLLRSREGLLSYVRRARLYHFVIDRFGQVFRIVPEDQVADHAGHSLWADASTVYEGLNESFIGVAFEAQTQTGFAATPAQIRSGRLLTEMLRAEYSIPEADCVTHAQVSVNPANMRIGYHTDWAARFPFHEFGFDQGYAGSVAAVELFGFAYDQHFLDAIGGHPWTGLLAAEAAIDRQARMHEMSPDAYRKILQQRYRLIRKQDTPTGLTLAKMNVVGIRGHGDLEE